MSREPTTEAGRRLLWFFDRPHPRAFDALLTWRIIEDFVPRIEAEARASGGVQVDQPAPDSEKQG